MSELVWAAYAGLLGLMVFGYLLAAMQAAIQKMSLPRLLALRDQKDVQAERIVQLMQSRSRLIATFNLAQMLTRFGALGLVVSLAQPAMALSAWVVVGLLLAAAFLFYWIEWLGEMFASRRPEAWTIRLGAFARILVFLLYPLVALPLAIERVRGDQQDMSNAFTEQELKNLVDAGHHEGVLEQDERKMIYSIFRLGDTLAREIMVPRIYITALEADIPLKQAVDALLESGYSRVPVYDDTIDQILGLLYTKDLLNVWREASQIDSLRSLLRPAYFVPEAKKVDELLAELQAMRVHMAIVVDEYGGIAGLVTLEDIVEEIVGEIQDEYDLREELPYQELGDGRFIFLGRVGLNDFNEVMQTNLPENEAETLGGYIYSRIGRVPNAGETVRVAQEPGTTDLVLTVEHVSGRRIRKVRAEMIPQTDDIAPAPGVPYAEEPNPDG